MATPRHRFAEVHGARQTTTEQDDVTWTFLAQPKTSAIAASTTCATIVDQVRSYARPFQPTLLQLQNLVLATTDPIKTGIYLRALTQLLLLHASSSDSMVGLSYSAASSGELVHPFITLARQRVDLTCMVLLETAYFLEQCNSDYHVIQTMGAFFDDILIDSPHSYALLQQLDNSRIAVDCRQAIYQYLIHVLERYPMQGDPTFYLTLVDFVCRTMLVDGILSESQAQDLALITLYQLLSRAYDAVGNAVPTLPYLERIQTVFSIQDVETDQPLVHPNAYIIWASLSFLLMTSQTADDQSILLDLMQNGQINTQAFKTVAMLPLLQTWAETSEVHKPMVLGLLEAVGDQSDLTHLTQEERENAMSQIEEHVANYPITGFLAHMITHLCHFFNTHSPMLSPLAMDDIHSVIFTTPLVFSKNTEERNKHLTIMVDLATQTDHSVSYKFPVLLLLLYLMRSHDLMSSDTFFHIYQTLLPQLVHPNDPLTTSRILQLLLPVVQGSHSSQLRETTMASVAFRVLVKVFERQPRVWQELKRVLANWVLHRKSAHRAPDTKSAIQMEIAVLSTMAKLCKEHANECAQDLLPMLMSLLQTCNSLSVSSLCYIMDAICACVRAGLVEPRPIWIVAINYVAAYAVEQAQLTHVHLLWHRLCDFFSIVGDMNEVSEVYMEFKDGILHEYLSALIISDVVSVRTAALNALSHFPAPDIAKLLPEKAKEVTLMIQEAPNSAYSLILTKLLSHELDHMRRSLFEEEEKKQHTEVADRGPAIGDQEQLLGKRYCQEWEEARVSPGLRSGYALAALETVSSCIPDRRAAGTETIQKTRWYRYMVTALADVSLTDHILIRVSALGTWKSLFEGAFGADNIESHGPALLDDLLRRLEGSTVPGITCNIFLALTGFVLTAHHLSSSFGAACASRVLQDILPRFLVPSVISDEIQFAALMCQGHLAGCIIANEKLASLLLNTMLEHVAKPSTPRSLDIAVNLVEFARGYAAAHFTAALATWPTKTAVVEAHAQRATATLFEHLGKHISESLALGIMMGWASMIRQADMSDVYWFAYETLQQHVDETYQGNKGTLLGACWVVAYAIEDEMQDEQSIHALRASQARALTQATMTQQLFHFTVPNAILTRKLLLGMRNLSEDSPAFSDEVDAALGKSDDTASLYVLAALLGADYVNRPLDLERVQAEAEHYAKPIRHKVLHALGTAAGLYGASTGPNLKHGRLAAVVCGKAIQATMRMRLKNTQSTAAQLLSLTEPSSYGRLNNNTSYLRAVFDALQELAEDSDDDATIDILLRGLRDTPGPLPPVNWFQLLRKLAKRSTALTIEALHFASEHANTSTSLTEFIVAQMTQPKQPMEVTLILMSETGLGKVLELSGLPSKHRSKHGPARRGMDAVTKKVRLSDMRCVEVVEVYTKQLMKLPQEVQLALLDTLNAHLTMEPTTLIQTLRDQVFYHLTEPLLAADKTDVPEILLRRAVECGVLNSETVRTLPASYPTAVALAEMCRLQRETQPAVWITEMVQALMEGFHSEKQTWIQVAKAIAASDQSTKHAWIGRLLDILIVVASDKRRAAVDRARSLENGVVYGLHCLFSYLWWDNEQDQALPRAVALADTQCMIVQATTGAEPHEQQRIVKRFYKLITGIQYKEDADQKEDPLATWSASFLQIVRLMPKSIQVDKKWIL